MQQILGIGVLVMIVADAFVGVRLLMLAARTRRLPEFSFGSSFLLMGVVGYPLSIVARKAAFAGAPIPALLPTALFFQNLASMMILVGTWWTFRAESRWLRPVLSIAALALVASLMGESLVAGAWTLQDGGPWYELGFWVRAGAFAWSAAEAGRYYALMRRRLVVGLADPVVVDRFRLWAVSSSAITAAFLVFYMGRLWAENVATSVPVLVATSLVGLIAGISMWLAFVPPVAYLRQFKPTLADAPPVPVPPV